MRPDQRLWVDLTQIRTDTIAAGLPGAGHRASAGAGAKGPRWYDRAVRLREVYTSRGSRFGLLLRRDT